MKTIEFCWTYFFNVDNDSILACIKMLKSVLLSHFKIKIKFNCRTKKKNLNCLENSEFTAD